MIIKTEEEFDECVKLINGIKVSDLVGSSPGFSNADYLFNEYNVVAELKCLEEDKIKDSNIRDKASEIYRRCLEENKAPVIVYGAAKISSEGFPEKYKKELIELYRKPIRRVMEKANKQIRETKKYLNKKDAHGLLILANDGHTALDPNHVMWILNETFNRDGFSSINSILFFTVNLIAEHPDINKNLLVWISSDRTQENKCHPQLLTRLQNKWFKRVNELTGESIDIIESENHEMINDITNK